MTDHAGNAPRSLRGSRILKAVSDAGVSYVLSVPDLVTADGLLKPVADGQTDFTLVRVCKEDEAIGISAGLSYGMKRSLVLIQHTGFLYASNAIRAMAVDQKLPIVMMIGLLGKEPDMAPAEAKSAGVRMVQPILDVMGIRHFLIDSDHDIEVIAPEIRAAYDEPHPVAFLISRSPLP